MTQPVNSSPENEKSSISEPTSKGSPGRITKIHSETRKGLFVALCFLIISLFIGILGIGTSWWVPLHLFLIGSLLSAISTTTQMLAVSWSTSPPPSSIIVILQRWGIAFGAVFLVLGREIKQSWMIIFGGSIVIFAVLLLASILLWILKHAVTKRFAQAIEAYIVAIVAGAIGMTIGLILGLNRGGELSIELRGAHLILNLFGLVGIVIAGTLPYFIATQVRSKMSPRATTSLKRITLFILSSAVVIAVNGEILKQAKLVTIGFCTYALGILLVLIMLPINLKNNSRWMEPRILQLMTGIIWWIATTITLGISTVELGVNRKVLQALVIGGFAQILISSLAYLGPVIRGGGHQLLTAGFAITRSWVSLVLGNIAALLSLFDKDNFLALVLMFWIVDIVVRAILLKVKKRTIKLKEN